MANRLRTDIGPSEVNIDTIDGFQNTTETTIDQIQTVDIENYEDSLSELDSLKTSGIYPDMRRFLTSIPSTGEKGMAVFLRS